MKKRIILIALFVSIVINAILMYLLISYKNVQHNGNVQSANQNIVGTDKDAVEENPADSAKNKEMSAEDEWEQQMFWGEKALFYGKWKIVEVVPATFSQPSYISGFYQDESGNIVFRGPDTSSIIGKEITFEFDYVESEGERHDYLSRPRTYTFPLSEDKKLMYNTASELRITGNYYSVVNFLLVGHDERDPEEPKVVRIQDIRSLYLKDKDTMYADAYYGITYKLERITD